MKTKLLIEQHFHGAYGVDFNKASTSDILDLSFQLKKIGIGAIFPTLVTDTLENIVRQISMIKYASQRQNSEMAKILGVHLEGLFLNPIKKGIHDESLFIEPTIDNYKLIEDDFIKIITVAPELCSDDLLLYLRKKGVKIQAGHCTGADLLSVDGTTHTFNAMSGVTHRDRSTTLSALLNDEIYTEIIADGVHVGDDALRLLFKCKPRDKIILISDSLPCTYSEISEFLFAGKKIFYDGNRASSPDGTLAGSTKLLPEIIKILASKKMFVPEFIDNSYKYHQIILDGSIEWDEEYNIVKVN